MPRDPSKILVVEDEAVVLHTLELILRHSGYEVRCARDGLEAVSSAVTFSPNVLLCDINLPDMNGIAVALEVKKAVPACRVVLLSGEISSTELLEEAKKQGHQFEVLAKPTDPQRLLQVIGGTRREHTSPSGIHRVK